MRLRDHYDWIVLGDDPGALFSASLAAHLGFSVLMLPLFPSPGLRLSRREGQSIEDLMDFDTNYVPGLGRGGLWRECLRRAGMTDEEQGRIQEREAMPQVVTPQVRVSLDPDRASLDGELGREFGDEAVERLKLREVLEKADPAIEKFWMELPERLTLRPSTKKDGSARDRADSSAKPPGGAWSLDRLADQIRKSGGRIPNGEARNWLSSDLKLKDWPGVGGISGIPEFLEGLQAAVTLTMAWPESSVFDSVHQLSLSRTAGIFRGGMSAFRQFLLELARRNGADLPEACDCRRIFVQDGRFAGVLPSNRGSMIGGTGGILGVPLERIQSILTQSGKSWWRSLKRPQAPVGWKFSVALTLHPEGIPPGMAPRVIWQERGAPPLELERVSSDDYGLSEPRRVILFIRTVMPLTEESLSAEFQRLTAARMLRKATEISPFLEYHIQRIFPDFRAEDERELREVYSYRSIAEIPAQLLCYSGTGLGAQSGLEGLFLSSRESFPGMGLQGSILSALEGVAWLAHRSGLSGPFKAS